MLVGTEEGSGWITILTVIVSELLLLAPLVLLADLLLLAGSEVVLNVESLPDLLRGFPFDHVGHGLAGHVQETLQDGREGGGGV